MVVSWFFCVYPRMGKSDKDMLGEILFVEGVFMIIVVGAMEVLR